MHSSRPQPPASAAAGTSTPHCNWGHPRELSLSLWTQAAPSPMCPAPAADRCAGPITRHACTLCRLLTRTSVLVVVQSTSCGVLCQHSVQCWPKILRSPVLATEPLPALPGSCHESDPDSVPCLRATHGHPCSTHNAAPCISSPVQLEVPDALHSVHNQARQSRCL